jgi:hypothetical protein
METLANQHPALVTTELVVILNKIIQKQQQL